MRRLVAVLSLFTLALIGCSDSQGGDSAHPQTTEPQASTDRTPTTESVESADFEIPDDLLARVEAEGYEFPEIDYPAQPEGVPWPTGEWPTGDVPAGVDAVAVDDAIQGAFNGGSGDSDVIDAVLVVKDGLLVVEEYNGWDPEELHSSWSMAKSITSSLVGILAGRGEIDVFDRAGAEEWSDPDDPRHEITVDELLRMSSGLQWTEDYDDPNGDVLNILAGSGMADRAGYTASKPLDRDPDTNWYYSTGTADVVAPRSCVQGRLRRRLHLLDPGQPVRSARDQGSRLPG